MNIKHLLAASCLGLAMAAGTSGAFAADSYPNKPIRIIVGYPAGGANDIVARAVGEKMSQELGQSIVIENVTGAAGTIGAATAARAAPDGYTLFMAAGAHTLAPSVRKNLPYDIVTDFTPISRAAIGTYVLVVNPSVEAKSVPELIALAKSKPGAMTFASSGVGAPLHLAGVLFQEKTGTELHHVPYRGDADANTAVMGGHVDMIFGSLGPLLPLIESGKVRALAVTSPERSAVLPDLPTIKETGVPDYGVSTWWGLLAPAGTPAPIIERLSKAMEHATSDPAIKTQFTKMGVEPAWDKPEDFKAFIAAEVEKYAAMTKAAGIEPQ